MICQSWKVMFHAEYSAGSPLRMLVDLRNVVDAALARTARKAAKEKSQPSAPRAKAAAAAAQFAPTSSDVPEFQVNSAPEWEKTRRLINRRMTTTSKGWSRALALQYALSMNEGFSPCTTQSCHKLLE